LNLVLRATKGATKNKSETMRDEITIAKSTAGRMKKLRVFSYFLVIARMRYLFEKIKKPPIKMSGLMG